MLQGLLANNHFYYYTGAPAQDVCERGTVARARARARGRLSAETRFTRGRFRFARLKAVDADRRLRALREVSGLRITLPLRQVCSSSGCLRLVRRPIEIRHALSTLV